jgi:hypothetical protein
MAPSRIARSVAGRRDGAKRCVVEVRVVTGAS